MKISIQRVKEIIKEELKLVEASSKVKRQIKNIMKYDHIDDLADYIEKFDIDKKYWRKMSMLFNRIRDEVQGRKPEGYADRYRKDLQKLLFKVIKEGTLTEAKRVMYVVGLSDGTVMRGKKAVSEKKALQIMSRISKQSDGWVNPFMIGVQYWNGTHPKRKGKPHKANKKKIMVKEVKLTEAKRVQLKIPIRDRKKVVNILQKKLRLKIMKDFDYGGSKGSYFFIDLDKKFYNKVLELLIKNRIKVHGT